jgi:hypothetical protein
VSGTFERDASSAVMAIRSAKTLLHKEDNTSALAVSRFGDRGPDEVGDAVLLETLGQVSTGLSAL